MYFLLHHRKSPPGPSKRVRVVFFLRTRIVADSITESPALAFPALTTTSTTRSFAALTQDWYQALQPPAPVSTKTKPTSNILKEEILSNPIKLLQRRYHLSLPTTTKCLSNKNASTRSGLSAPTWSRRPILDTPEPPWVAPRSLMFCGARS